MARRILLTLLMLSLPAVAFAQNDVGVWLNTTQYKTTTLTDVSAPGSTFKIKIDHKAGYGVSFNHFSGPNMSTEFAWQQIRGDAKATAHILPPGGGGAIDQTVDIGDFKANVLSGVLKWHFNPRGFIVPYLGAGVAYFSGAQVRESADFAEGDVPQTAKFKNKFNFMVDGGANFAVTPRIAIGADVRYAPFKAIDKSDPESESVTLDPITLSLGVRFRM